MPLFRQALKADPSDVASVKGYAQGARVLHLWDELVEALERLLAVALTRADIVDAHLASARVLDEHLGDPRRARAHFERVMLVDPSQIYPYLALAELDLREGTWSRAIAHADHGLELCPTEREERPWFWACKGLALHRVSRSMGPVSTFFRGLRGEPGDHDPAEQALAKAAVRLEVLRQRTPAQWLADIDGAVGVVHRHIPRPPLPTWWFPSG
jgi:tetratricopeptide (TPR) repeat protein